jgi:hypothetical protein
MKKKHTNNSRLNTKSKILVLGLMLIMLVGFFGFVSSVEAQGVCTSTTPTGVPEPQGCDMTKTPCGPANPEGLPTPIGCNQSLSSTAPSGHCESAHIDANLIPNRTPPQWRNADNVSEGYCHQQYDRPDFAATWTANATPAAATQTDAEKKAADEEARKKELFGECSLGSTAVIEGCIVRGAFLIFITLGSKILYMTAYIFNIMLSLTLSTVLYKNNFLPEAWRIVRDFSNIFFILVLLYISIKMIIGLGGAGVKKMIASVIVAALLINFSMFMTQVVIDASNILALIFYNKISVNSLNPRGITEDGIPYTPATDKAKTEVEEKDIAGGIVAGFNPINFLNPANNATIAGTATTGNYASTGGFIGGYASYFSAPCASSTIGATIIGAEKNPCTHLGEAIGGLISSDEKKLPSSVALAIIFTGGAVFLMAAYAFFIAGLAFIGRLIELWMLIIFSPFAFLSLSIPELASVKYFGWKEWIDRLLTVAFMAPIFMFFMLLISKLVQINILGNLASEDPSKSVTRALIIMTIPAIIYITMLYKATEYAKKGAGEVGALVIKYGQMAAGIAGGIALTAASGGATTLVGGVGGAALGGLGKGAERVGSTKWGGRLGFNKLGSGLRDASDYLREAKFDPRAIKALGIGKTISKGGLGEAKGESWNEKKKKQEEKQVKRAEVLEKRGTIKEKIEVADAEIKLKEATLPVKLDLAKADKEIEKARATLNDEKLADDAIGSNAAAIAAAKTALDVAKRNKDIIRGAKHTNAAGVVVAEVAGGLASLEKEVHAAKQRLDERSDEITTRYATGISEGLRGGFSKSVNLLWRGGEYSIAGANEAARKIRTGTKLDSGEKPK